MRMNRDNSYQTASMVISFLVAAVFTGMAIHVARHYPESRIRERIVALPVLAIEEVLYGRAADNDTIGCAYTVGFGCYLVTTQWLLSVTLPGLYRRVFGGKGGGVPV